jgi:plasmid stabilization system protein ParE
MRHNQSMSLKDGKQLFMQNLQAFMRCHFRGGADRSTFHHLQTFIRQLGDNPVSGDRRTGIEPDHQHGLFFFHGSQSFFADLQIGIDILDIIQIFNIFDQPHDLDSLLAVQPDLLFGTMRSSASSISILASFSKSLMVLKASPER